MKRRMGVDRSFVLFTLRKLQLIRVGDPIASRTFRRSIQAGISLLLQTSNAFQHMPKEYR